VQISRIEIWVTNRQIGVTTTNNLRKYCAPGFREGQLTGVVDSDVVVLTCQLVLIMPLMLRQTTLTMILIRHKLAAGVDY
jgi:hypothetical protein